MFLTVLVLSWFACATCHAAPPSHVQVRLVTETQTLHPGQPVWLAVVLTMEPGWHTYWRNPGDSGLPTTIRWSVPRGFDVGPIEWPAPKPFVEQEVTSYGYDGQVLLLSKLTPPAALPEGQVKLSAKVEWLECREMCLKGSREVNLDVPVRNTTPNLDPQWAPAFAKTRERVPQPTDQWDFHVTRRAKKLTLAMQFADELGPELASVQFFPMEAGLIEPNAPQKLSQSAEGYTLEMIGSFVSSLTPPVRLRGVLIVQETGEPDAMPTPQVVSLDVPIEGTR